MQTMLNAIAKQSSKPKEKNVYKQEKHKDIQRKRKRKQRKPLHSHTLLVYYPSRLKNPNLFFFSFSFFSPCTCTLGYPLASASLFNLAASS
jgi:hypothetical protein